MRRGREREMADGRRAGEPFGDRGKGGVAGLWAPLFVEEGEGRLSGVLRAVVQDEVDHRVDADAPAQGEGAGDVLRLRPAVDVRLPGAGRGGPAELGEVDGLVAPPLGLKPSSQREEVVQKIRLRRRAADVGVHVDEVDDVEEAGLGEFLQVADADRIESGAADEEVGADGLQAGAHRAGVVDQLGVGALPVGQRLVVHGEGARQRVRPGVRGDAVGDVAPVFGRVERVPETRHSRVV